MKNFLGQLAVLVFLPIFFINLFGGIIAFVWLTQFESEWTLIIQGVIAFFFSSLILADSIFASRIWLP